MPDYPVGLRYEYKGYTRVRNSLRKLASEYRKEIDSVVKDWTEEERQAIKSHGYPPQRRAPQPFKTDRQRRWFFWALDAGIITVPYKRTGRLASGWRKESQGWADWVLKNSAAYASLVVGRDHQAVYHKGHWWIAEETLEKDVPDLTKTITKELVKLFGEDIL